MLLEILYKKSRHQGASWREGEEIYYSCACMETMGKNQRKKFHSDIKSTTMKRRGKRKNNTSQRNKNLPIKFPTKSLQRRKINLCQMQKAIKKERRKE